MDKEQTVLLAKNIARLPGSARPFRRLVIEGAEPPCSHCHACLLRERGFTKAQIVDPLIARLTPAANIGNRSQCAVVIHCALRNMARDRFSGSRKCFTHCRVRDLLAVILLSLSGCSGCNLACYWCDTEFESSTWKPDLEGLLEKISQLRPDACDLIVITGGEPFRQNIKPLRSCFT